MSKSVGEGGGAEFAKLDATVMKTIEDRTREKIAKNELNTNEVTLIQVKNHRGEIVFLVSSVAIEVLNEYAKLFNQNAEKKISLLDEHAVQSLSVKEGSLQEAIQNLFKEVVTHWAGETIKSDLKPQMQKTGSSPDLQYSPPGKNLSSVTNKQPGTADSKPAPCPSLTQPVATTASPAMAQSPSNVGKIPPEKSSLEGGQPVVPSESRSSTTGQLPRATSGIGKQSSPSPPSGKLELPPEPEVEPEDIVPPPSSPPTKLASLRGTHELPPEPKEEPPKPEEELSKSVVDQDDFVPPPPLPSGKTTSPSDTTKPAKPAKPERTENAPKVTKSDAGKVESSAPSTLSKTPPSPYMAKPASPSTTEKTEAELKTQQTQLFKTELKIKLKEKMNLNDKQFEEITNLPMMKKQLELYVNNMRLMGDDGNPVDDETLFNRIADDFMKRYASNDLKFRNDVNKILGLPIEIPKEEKIKLFTAALAEKLNLGEVEMKKVIDASPRAQALLSRYINGNSDIKNMDDRLDELAEELIGAEKVKDQRKKQTVSADQKPTEARSPAQSATKSSSPDVLPRSSSSSANTRQSVESETAAPPNFDKAIDNAMPKLGFKEFSGEKHLRKDEMLKNGERILVNLDPTSMRFCGVSVGQNENGESILYIRPGFLNRLPAKHDATGKFERQMAFDDVMEMAIEELKKQGIPPPKSYSIVVDRSQDEQPNVVEGEYNPVLKRRDEKVVYEKVDNTKKVHDEWKDRFEGWKKLNK